MKKKYLIIVNRASNYFPFYFELGKRLESNGHAVFFAIDSHFTPLLYSLNGFEKYESFYFSDYFQEHFASAVMNEKYERVNVWRQYFSDFERAMYYSLNKRKTKEYYHKLNICLLNFFEEIFNSKQIDAVIYENVSNSFCFAAYTVSKIMNKKYIGLSVPRLPNRFEITDSLYGNGKKIEQSYNELLDEDIALYEEDENYKEAKEYVEGFFTIQPDYMKNNILTPHFNFFQKYFNAKKIKLVQKSLIYILSHFKEAKFIYQGYPLVINYFELIRNIKRKYRLMFVDKFFDKIDSNDNYYFYPLHYHPEASTSINAPDYINDYENILKISFNLPFGTFLYVKEHISNVGYPKLNFYKKIKLIPNVKLIHYKENAKDLIKRSKAVITVTSTVGYEAIILNKRCYVFGNVFYDFHPLCVKINAFDDLFDHFIKDLEYSKTYDPLPFILAYYQNTFKGGIRYQSPIDQTLFVNDYLPRLIISLTTQEDDKLY